ncbi:hypothetical protein BRD01_07270 [Halobacteriales archaeon QS_8_65_32]|nr:MAG: hypothetical protein BRD01_07270 [Halobacteriales archaeon QS_8_65_32]
MGAVAPVSAQVALVWTLTALLCVLIVIALSTVGGSIRAARRDRREAAAVSRVTSGLFDRLDADDPDWAGWVEDLSSIEERVLRARVDRYLRVLAGSDGRRFAALGAWLALLDHPIDADALLADCGADPDERAATARVLFERDVPEASSLGTDLLVRTGRSLSLFGLDTLYRLNNADPHALLAAGAAEREGWTDAFLAQVLDVIARCSPASESPIDWLLDCLVHETGAVRAAAVRAIETYAHREDVRDRLAIVWLVTDPEPIVRRAVYRYLAAYGDEADVEALIEAAMAEPDARALSIVASELADQFARPGAELSPSVRRSLEWIDAERAVTAGRSGRDVGERNASEQREQRGGRA